MRRLKIHSGKLVWNLFTNELKSGIDILCFCDFEREEFGFLFSIGVGFKLLEICFFSQQCNILNYDCFFWRFSCFVKLLTKY